MAKYIDAEKLRAKINELLYSNKIIGGAFNKSYANGVSAGYSDILSLIDSSQHHFLNK